MKKAFVLSVVALLFSAGSVFANSAGCGLGKIVFGGKSGILFNVLAVTTNGSFGSQTFGITSGTSGCSSSDVVLQEKEAEVFVAANYDRIIEDASQGEGQYLASMGSLIGCESPAFASAIQSNYDDVFSSEDAVVVIDSAKTMIANDPALAKTCGK